MKWGATLATTGVFLTTFFAGAFLGAVFLAHVDDFFGAVFFFGSAIKERI